MAELTAREATLLTLLASNPLTKMFRTIYSRLESPQAKLLALQIRAKALKKVKDAK